MDYQNFDLEIDADGPNPVARTNGSGQGQRQDLDALLPELTEDEPANGDILFRWLFRDKILTSFRQALSVLTPNSCGLRVRLHFDGKSAASMALHSLPWELLFDADHQRFLARNAATPLVRILTGGQFSCQAAPANGKIRILLAAASPADRSPLQLFDELLRIRNVVPDASFEICENATREKLQRLLTLGTFQVLHVMGHGGIVDGKRLFALENENRNADLLTPLDFIQLVPSHRYPLLTILNFCNSANADASRTHPDFASSLVDAGLPAVLGLSTKINDRVAIDLSQSLYQSLAERRCIEEAVALGRTCLKEKWSHPVLYMQRHATSRLVASSPLALSAAAAAKAAAADADFVKWDPVAPRSIQAEVYVETSQGGIHTGGRKRN